MNPGHEQRILGIAGSLLQAVERPYNVETQVEVVERRLNCMLNTESDCVTILQQGASPREILVEFAPLENNDDDGEKLVCQVCVRQT